MHIDKVTFIVNINQIHNFQVISIYRPTDGIYFQEVAVQTVYLDELQFHDYSISCHPRHPDVDLIKSLQDQIDSFHKDIVQLKKEKAILEKHIKECEERLFDIHKFKDDASAVKVYTGFRNYDTLMSFYHYLEPKVNHLQPWKSSNTKDNMEYQAPDKSKPGPKSKLDNFK